VTRRSLNQIQTRQYLEEIGQWEIFGRPRAKVRSKGILPRAKVRPEGVIPRRKYNPRSLIRGKKLDPRVFY
jgi:hypothetical protein